MPIQQIRGRHMIEWLPTQRRALGAVGSMKYSGILFCGGFGVGKSRFLGEVALELSMNYPGTEFLFWRKTRASIKDTTYRIFLEKIIPPWMIRKHNRSALMIIDRFGSRYDFLGLDRITRKGSYWGDACLIDEAIELEEAEVRMIEGRLRSKNLPRPQLISVTNPGAPGSFWHKEYVEKAGLDKTIRYFSATSFENINNPPAYFERLEKWKGTQYYDRYVLAKWRGFEGIVWSTFDPHLHVIDPFEIPKNWRKTISVDFGYDNPAVILWVAEDPLSGKRYVYRQFYKTRTLVRYLTKIVNGLMEKAEERYDEVWCDHEAEARAQFDEDLAGGLRTRPARKEVLPGLQAVELAFRGHRGLYIFNDSWCEKDGYWYGLMEKDPLLAEQGKPTCLQEEIPRYKFGKNDAPIKEFDHGADALRYDIYSEDCERKGVGLGEISARLGPSRQ